MAEIYLVHWVTFTFDIKAQMIYARSQRGCGSLINHVHVHVRIYMYEFHSPAYQIKLHLTLHFTITIHTWVYIQVNYIGIAGA